MSQVPSPSPNTTQATPLGSDRARHGLDETPEEPLTLSPEEGYGYYPSIVIGHRLNRYEVVRKVRTSGLLYWCHGMNPWCAAWVG
jgi:hypothetical protein